MHIQGVVINSKISAKRQSCQQCIGRWILFPSPVAFWCEYLVPVRCLHVWPIQTRQCKYEPAQLPRETTQKVQLSASQRLGRFSVRTEAVKRQVHGVARVRERAFLLGHWSAKVAHKEHSYWAWFQWEPLWIPWELWVLVPTIWKPLLHFDSLADHSASFWNIAGCTGYVPTCAQLGV